MSIKKPLVLGGGRAQQLQPADQLDVETEVERLTRLFRKLLVSCDMQGVHPLDDELQEELELAMVEN